MHLETQSVTRPVAERLAKSRTFQYPPGCCIHFSASFKSSCALTDAGPTTMVLERRHDDGIKGGLVEPDPPEFRLDGAGHVALSHSR